MQASISQSDAKFLLNGAITAKDNAEETKESIENSNTVTYTIPWREHEITKW